MSAIDWIAAGLLVALVADIMPRRRRSTAKAPVKTVTIVLRRQRTGVRHGS